MADAFTLDSRKWEAFIRGLDRQSVNEFRKGLRKSASALRKAIRADWSGILQRRTGKSWRSITQRIVSTARLMSGRPIEGRVSSRRFTVRLHEKGYDLKRTKGGPVIKHIPGKNIFEHRTNAHTQIHRRIMEETIRGLVRRVTGF